MNPEDARIQHYVYNIPKGEYDDVFLFLRKGLSGGIASACSLIC